MRNPGKKGTSPGTSDDGPRQASKRSKTLDPILLVILWELRDRGSLERVKQRPGDVAAHHGFTLELSQQDRLSRVARELKASRFDKLVGEGLRASLVDASKLRRLLFMAIADRSFLQELARNPLAAARSCRVGLNAWEVEAVTEEIRKINARHHDHGGEEKLEDYW